MKQLLIIILLLSAICSTAQKTRNILAKDGETINVKIGKGSIKVQINGKTVYTTDTIPTEKVLYSKDFTDLQTAINTAVTQNLPLLLDSVTITVDEFNKLYIFGKLTLRAYPNKRAKFVVNFAPITRNEVFAITIGSSTPTFENIDFICANQTTTRGGSCFFTEQGNTVYNTTFSKCNWIGDWRYNYQSSAAAGRVVFNGCNLSAYFENIQHFGQAGTKKLIMFNSTLYCKESHNIYQHPWMSDSLINVTSLGSGKLAMNNYATTILPYQALHKVYIHCQNADTAKALIWATRPMWRLWGSSITIDSSNLPTYEWNGNFKISNTHITNAGNGSVIYGTASLNNCTGEVTAVNKMNITNSNIQVIAQDGADLTVSNSSISLYNKFKPSFFKASFTKSNIGEFDLSATNFKIKFENCNFGNQYKTIRLFGKVSQMDDIEFIGNSYPIATY